MVLQAIKNLMVGRSGKKANLNYMYTSDDQLWRQVEVMCTSGEGLCMNNPHRQQWSSAYKLYNNPIYGPHAAHSYCIKLQHQKHMKWCTTDMWKSTTNVGCTHALPINLVELVMIVVVWMVVVTVVVEFGSIEVPLHPLVLPCTSIAWESQTEKSTLHQTGWKVLDHQQQGHLPVVLWSIKNVHMFQGDMIHWLLMHTVEGLILL